MNTRERLDRRMRWLGVAMYAGFGLFFVGSVIGIVFGPQPGLAASLVLPGFAVAFVASMGIQYLAMRCLRCGGNFGPLVMQWGGLRIDRRLRFCPYCSVSIDEEPPPVLSGSSKHD
jgi:hypothetical protein